MVEAGHLLANASCLNQAEILIHAFKPCYLKRSRHHAIQAVGRQADGSTPAHGLTATRPDLLRLRDRSPIIIILNCLIIPWWHRGHQGIGGTRKGNICYFSW